MNLVLLGEREIDEGGRVVLAGRRAVHLWRVVRVRPGDRLRVGVAHGAIGSAEVVVAGPERVELAVELAGDRPERPPVDLILAIPRPKMLSRAIRIAASFGVGRIDLANAWRVDKSYLDSPRLAKEALERELWLGCEQGGTTWVPEVAVHRLLMPFLERLPPPDPVRRRLLAHPGADRPLEAVLAPGSQCQVAVAVGPEGGWIEREVEAFSARGFAPVHLGPRILRVEAAVPALLSQVDLLRRLRS